MAEGSVAIAEPSIVHEGGPARAAHGPGAQRHQVLHVVVAHRGMRQARNLFQVPVGQQHVVQVIYGHVQQFKGQLYRHRPASMPLARQQAVQVDSAKAQGINTFVGY